jgi:hypothetical protein
MKTMFLKTQILSLVSISLIGVIVLTNTLVYVSAEPSSCLAPPSGMIE